MPIKFKEWNSLEASTKSSDSEIITIKGLNIELINAIRCVKLLNIQKLFIRHL